MKKRNKIATLLLGCVCSLSLAIILIRDDTRGVLKLLHRNADYDHARALLNIASRAPVSLESLHGKRIMVLIAVGQSNAANHGGTPRRVSRQILGFHEGSLYEGHDPLKGATGYVGSVWTRLGEKLVRAGFADVVVIAPAAVGGSSVADWSPGGRFYPRLALVFQSLDAVGLEPACVIWHQGEADSSLRTPPDQYREMLRKCLSGIRALGCDARIIICRATRRQDGQLDEGIRAAQWAVTDRSKGILEGPDTDYLDEHFRRDGLHFNDAGLEAFAEKLLETIRAHGIRASPARQKVSPSAKPTGENRASPEMVSNGHEPSLPQSGANYTRDELVTAPRSSPL